MLVANALGSGANEASAGLAAQIAEFFTFLIGRVPSWIAGFVVFVLSIFVAKMAKSSVESKISDQVDEEHQGVLILAGRVTYFGTLVLGITIALKIAGIDLTAILAAVAFGVGFALRDLIGNFFAGVLILVGRQFSIGDFIHVGNTSGRVMEIQSRCCIIKAIDGTKVIVPNSKIFTSEVVCTTANPLRRIDIPMYISYDTDIKYATKVTMDFIKKNPKIFKKPAPSVIVKDYGDSTIDMQIRCWVDSRSGWLKLKSDLMHQLWELWQEAGIVVPYNIMHLETEQDTAEYVKEASELSKKRKEQMAEAKAKRDAKKAAELATGAPAVQTTNGLPAAPDVNGQAPLAPASLTPALAAQTVAAENVVPESEYHDLVEIDGQG